ncbi:HNH endonuclease [Streptomyces phaeochromogenes]
MGEAGLNRGARRTPYRPYMLLWQRAFRLEERGDLEAGRTLRRQMKTMPSRDPDDPGYRRLNYCRYADDWLLGFTGPKREAGEIKADVGRFLHDELKLELSEDKTLITHGRTKAARFLGYEIVVLDNDTKYDQRGHRSINAQIGLKVPADVIRAKCRLYTHHGRPVRRTERTVNNDFSIVAQYQAEFRGIAGYYQLAFNLHRLGRLKYMMQRSLVKTLARKYRARVPRIHERYRTVLKTDQGPRRGLEVTVERGEGRKLLVAQWGGVSLKGKTRIGSLDDHATQVWNSARNEVIKRLLVDTCEMCGAHDGVEVHHIRHFKDLTVRGRVAKHAWAQMMAARRRKALVVCRVCHEDIHYGASRSRQNSREEKGTGEPDAVTSRKSGSVEGRRKRTWPLAPRWRPTQRPVRFGKGPSEKDPNHGHLVGGLFHLKRRGLESERKPARQSPTLPRQGR